MYLIIPHVVNNAVTAKDRIGSAYTMRGSEE